jgi:hypothetical protein
MQSFDKRYIKNKLNELKTQINNRKFNSDLCRALFTNDFAFYCFQKFLNDIDKSTVASQMHLISHDASNNMFLVCKNWLFGVNDDGKIFVIYLDSNLKSQSLKDVYQIFGYDMDILDDRLRDLVSYSKNTIHLKFYHKSIKYCNLKHIRVCGDLIITFDYSNVIYRFKDLLTLYIYQLWMRRLNEHGILVNDAGTPFTVYMNRNSQMKNLLIDELIAALKAINCNVISREDDKETDSVTLICKLENFEIKIVFNYHTTISGYSFVTVINTNINQLDFAKCVLKTIGINPNEQNIIINVGNHKVILNGYYFPLITIGTSLISLDFCFATKVLLRHPEHHDVEITFPDLVEVEFDTIRFPQSHQMLRNEYFVKQIMKLNDCFEN